LPEVNPLVFRQLVRPALNDQSGDDPFLVLAKDRPALLLVYGPVDYFRLFLDAGLRDRGQLGPGLVVQGRRSGHIFGH
jgi:hypothetical protein